MEGRPSNGRSTSGSIHMANFLSQNTLQQSQPEYYHQQFKQLSSEDDLPPPDFDPAFKTRTDRLKVLPRDEEGREALPMYSCSLARESVFDMKREFSSPFDRVSDRKWDQVFVRLEGTMLSIYKVKYPGFFGSKPSKENYTASPDRPIGASQGNLIRRFGLQHAEVGRAADYRK
jgi:hypothetical protein